LRTGKEKEFHLPKSCPVCGTKLTKNKGEVVWRCPNPRCFAQQRRYFHHFVSKNAFNIVGLGPRIIDRLIGEGLVSDPADIFKLKEGDIQPLEGFAEKSARNLIYAIQSKKKIPFPKFIYALGIRNVGEETAQDLAERFEDLEKLRKASLGDLEKTRDVGPIVARSIFGWFSQKRNSEFLEKLKKAGVDIVKEKETGHRPLKGKTFVLTGGLESLTRDEAKEKIRSLGGDISESVSPKTDFVVAGKEPGSKYEKAKKLNIKIITEKQFLALLK
jgi:DNA ligase (NAD+)